MFKRHTVVLKDRGIVIVLTRVYNQCVRILEYISITNYSSRAVWEHKPETKGSGRGVLN